MHTEAFSFRWQEQGPAQKAPPPQRQPLVSPFSGSSGIAPTRPPQHLLATGARPKPRPQALAPPLPSAPPPLPSPPSHCDAPLQAPAPAPRPAHAHRWMPGLACRRPGVALHTLVCAVAFAALEGAAIVAPARCVHPGAGLHYQVGGGPGTAGAGCLHGHGSATDGLLLALLPLLAMYVGRHATRPTSPGLGHAVAWAGAVAVCTSSLCILGESCVLAGAAHAMYVAKRGVQAGTVLSVSLYFTLHRAPQVSTRGSMMEAACVMLVAVLLSCLVAAIQEATTVMMLWGLMAVSMALLAPPSCTYTPAPH